ncbi:MAG: DEAD/DEAH box helicase, partial [Propionibacterium sp.]|nr:DEAD/DEAH box helicase [Propionibacterium sp.]
MLVVHAHWSDGLVVWAEDAGLAVSSPSQALRSARPHPFAASAETLDGLLPGTPGTAELRLPSLRKSPLDSPELVRTAPRPAARTAPALLRWTVPVMRLAPAAARSWLDDAGDTEARFGASITYLGDIARFAGELVERGRILPELLWEDAGPVAAWRPVLQGPDVLAYQQLVGAMPPVCRAFADAPAARVIVDGALRHLLDAAVRDRLPEPGALLPPRRGRRPKVLPAAEAWVAALTGPEGRFEADDAALDSLGLALQPWDELGGGDVGPARATFRLVDEQAEDDDAPDGTDPAAASPTWRVEFLLQSTADPSLLIPAARVWDDAGALGRWVERPQELMLTELGRANRVYPALAAGLRQARPEHLELDAAGAYEFLTTAAPALDEAGFGVLVPNWWERRRRLGMKLKVSTPSDAGEGGWFVREELCDFDWRLAVGDESLTDEEIDLLSAAKAPLVRLRGQWVAVDQEQLRRSLAFLDREGRRRATVAEVLQLAAAHPDDADLPLEVTGVEADGWLGALLDGTAAQQIEAVTPPDALLADLRPYQQRGLSWLAFLSRLGLGALLADDMGLGKTLQLLALEATERDRHDDVAPSLLLCPMSLIGNWQAEAAKFAPHLRLYAHHGTGRLAGDELTERLASTDVVVTTYATATRDVDELAGIRWHRVVLDEAQAIKNRLSRTTKAVGRLGGEHRVALTGTPVENRLGELWSIMNFLNPGLLGSAETFRTRYAIPVERHGDAQVAARLRQISRPYLLRRVKTDPMIIDDLPEKIEVKQYYRLTGEQASLYQSVVDDMMARIADSDGIER